MEVPKTYHKKKRPKNNPVPTEIKRCWHCGRYGLMQTHECFGGSPNRQLSIKYGLQIKLCYICHQMVTENKLPDLVQEIKEWGQRKFEQTYSREDFLRIFGKNYLGDD